MPATSRPDAEPVDDGPDLPPVASTDAACFATCVSTTEQAFAQCLAGGGEFLNCAEGGQTQLLHCLRTRCSNAPSDDACDVSCHWHSEKVYGRCGSSSPGSAYCADESRLTWYACQTKHCGNTPPAPPCDTHCHARGQEHFAQCIAVGTRPEACSEQSSGIAGQCLRDECDITGPRSPCQLRCQDLAEDARQRCLSAGNAPSACQQAAGETGNRCLEDECGIVAACAAGCARQRLFDRRGDAVHRPMSADWLPDDSSVEPPIDLWDVTLGTWMATAPATDPFDGQYRSDGQFLRLELRFGGLVNPPGSADPALFLPFVYGRRPVYAYVEIDVDRDVTTGGEIDFPQYRYLTNAGRFGGLPARASLRDRVSVESAQVDELFSTPPYVERHGEEFHLALLGGQELFIVERRGDGDRRFERDEAWAMRGSFIHRAHGFELFSLASGGRVPGEYAPLCDLLFQHDPVKDITTVSAVFPLTNAGAAQLRNRPTEPLNGDPTDQASVLEGLEDLLVSAKFLQVFPTDLPEEEIIRGWASRTPPNHLAPAAWTLTALVGTAPKVPLGQFGLVWTDIWPDALTGDLDGNGMRTDADNHLLEERISTRDGADGSVDGMAQIFGFPQEFSAFDVNYDGVLSHLDFVRAEGDTDEDGDVDLNDVAAFQRCFGSAGAFPPCMELNLLLDPAVDEGDLPSFTWLLTGPGGH